MMQEVHTLQHLVRPLQGTSIQRHLSRCASAHCGIRICFKHNIEAPLHLLQGPHGLRAGSG